MFPRLLVGTVLLLGIAHAPGGLSGQPGDGGSVSSPPAASASASEGQVVPADESESARTDYPPPHITVAVPPPAPSSWQDRTLWAACLAFAILAYAGMMMALVALRKIERQTRSAETAAVAAADGAQAALRLAQTILRAERPWILVTAEPAVGVENSFDIVATNRGRGPARIIATEDEMVCAADETQLAATPAYRRTKSKVPLSPVILLPGEYTRLKSFSRADVKAFCQTEEQLKRMEHWEERIFLFGRVSYTDLLARADPEVHETSWCYWHVHGRQKSALVLAGPPDYHLHS